MGSAEILLRKKPSEKEVINDYNGDLVNLFRTLQNNDNLKSLIGRLYFSFNSEEMFRENKHMLAGISNILDDVRETEKIIRMATKEEIEQAARFLENQVFSFSSTGKTFAIAGKDMTKRFGRLVAACKRLRDVIIMHRDYKDVISMQACKDALIFLDPPYKNTEKMYQKSCFDGNEHVVLFDFMYEIHNQFGGECKFIITYNNDPFIHRLAEERGFYTYVKPRQHNMKQSSSPGEMFEELLIGNYDLVKQSEENESFLSEKPTQLTLFEFQCDY